MRTVVVACLVCIVPLSDYLFYGRVDVELHSVRDWLCVAPIGVAGGLLGGIFARLVARTMPRVTRLGACVDQRRLLVVDQELVEGDPVGLGHRRDPVDAAGDVVDPCLHRGLLFDTQQCAVIEDYK